MLSKRAKEIGDFWMCAEGIIYRQWLIGQALSNPHIVGHGLGGPVTDAIIGADAVLEALAAEEVDP
jgi:hypothetical protein